MAVTQAGPAPYTSPRSVLDLIRRYRDRGLQSPFTRDVLVRAGVADSLVTRTLQTLVILDLIDDQWAPTATLEGLRRAPQSEYSQRFADFLRAAYQEVFSFVDPLTSTLQEIRDAFRAYQPHAQQERMVALFLGLCEEAGLLGENARQRPTQDSQRRQDRVRAAVRVVAAGAAVGNARAPARNASSSRTLPTALSGLLDSLPKDGESWPQQRRDNFVKTFGAVLDFCYPLVEGGDTQSTTDLGANQ